MAIHIDRRVDGWPSTTLSLKPFTNQGPDLDINEQPKLFLDLVRGSELEELNVDRTFLKNFDTIFKLIYSFPDNYWYRSVWMGKLE